jgi:hypothetical protein
MITTRFSKLLPVEKPPKIFSHIPTEEKVSGPENVDMRKGSSITAKSLLS